MSLLSESRHKFHCWEPVINYANLSLLQIRISLLSNSSGCVYGLTFDDEAILFRP